MKRFLLGPLQLDAGQRVLYRDGEIIALSPKSFNILLVLVENAGQVVSRDAIRQQVWKDAFIEDANLTNNISQLRNVLRQHLGTDPIRTFSKRGYQLTAEVVCSNGDEQASEEFVAAESGAPEITQRLETTPGAKAQVSIETGYGIHSTALRTGFKPVPLTEQSAWTRKTLAAVLMLTVIGSVTLLGLSRKSASAAAPPSLAIVNFRNLSISHEQDWMGTALEETIGADMTRDGGMRLVSGERSAEVEHDFTLVPTKIYDDKTIQAIGKRLDCEFVMVGFYVPVGDLIRIDLQLRNARTGAVIRDFSQIAPQGSFLEVAANASTDLRKSIGIAPPQALVEDAAMNSSSDGLRLYAEGLRLFREDKATEAEQMLSKAVEASPQSPLPHSALATVWNQMGFDQKSAAEARLALNTSTSLPQKQKLALQASAYECLNDWTHALETYSTLHKDYPDDLDYVLGIARSEVELGKAKDVLQMLTSLRQTSPAAANDPRVSMQQAEAASQISDHRSQLLYAGDAVRLAEAISARHLEARALVSEGFAWDYMGDNHRGLEDGHRAEELAEQIGNDQDLTSALSEEGQIERALQLPEAEPTLLRAYDLAEKADARIPMGSLLIGLGNIRADVEDWEGARRDFQIALDIDAEINRPRREVVALVGLAQVAANTDNPQDERAYAIRAQNIATPMNDLENLTFVFEDLGQVEEREGNLNEAKRQLQQGIDVALQSGNPDRIGFLLQDMLRLQIQLGNIAGARQLQAQVLSMRPQNVYIIAASKVDEATLQLDEGHPEKVIAPMTELATAQPVRTYPAAEAWRLVAEAEIAKGDLLGARIAIDKALNLDRKSPDTISFLIPVSLVAAKLDAAEGHHAKAERELDTLLRDAQRLKNPELQLETRLVEADLQKQSPMPVTAAHLLQSVKLEATQRGFGLIAEKANTDLAKS